MGDLLTPLETIKKVKGNEGSLESSFLIRGDPPRNGSQRPKPLIEIAETKVAASKESKYQTKPSPPIVSTSIKSSPPTNPHKKKVSTAFLEQTYLQDSGSSTLCDDAREILKSQPDHVDLAAVLKYLRWGIEKKHDFNIHATSASAAQIINALVTVTIPDQWTHLSAKKLSKEDAQMKEDLLCCLTCIAGLGALLTQIRKMSTLSGSGEYPYALVQDFISVLDKILAGPFAVSKFLEETLMISDKPTQRLVVWQEFTSIIAGSKVLSVISQTSATKSSDSDEADSTIWLGDGAKYSAWLARNVSFAAIKLNTKETEAWTMLAQIIRRGFSLGHRDCFVSEIYSTLLLDKKSKALWTTLHQLLGNLPRWEQKTFFDSMLKDIVQKHLNGGLPEPEEGRPNVLKNRSVEGVAALIAGVVRGNEYLEDCITEWLMDFNGSNSLLGVEVKRALFATLANHEGKLQTIVERSLEAFGDKLHIQHTSVLQQEATAQIVLLAVGHLNRLNPDGVKSVIRSSLYLCAISNRLGASMPRARYLGMVVGEAISKVVDESGKALKFDIKGMDMEDSRKWFELVNIEDNVGSIEDLQNRQKARNLEPASLHIQPKLKRFQQPEGTDISKFSKIISIEEVDNGSSDDEDLIPYQKPDEDPSDSDEDPTLINRSKPKAPVYIIDLIKYLQSEDKPEVVQIALRTAPSLIRRKAGFGTEISENIDRITSTLLNLGGVVLEESSEQLRLQALIACVIAMPERLGRWLASMYFEGDFSLIQRATLLTTVGLGVREIAGHTDDPALASQPEDFPSERLPQRLSAIYRPLNSIASQISQTTLQPMALAAADTMSGPNILKVRTFSSRLDVEKKTAQRAKERSTRIPKNLHKLLADSFYLPLACRMSLLLSTHPPTRQSTIFEPHILRLFLQTLCIILNTIGPHALQLPAITRETLLLITQLHSTPTLSLDPAVLPPILQLLLSTLGLNMEAGNVAEERLVTDFGSEIAELMAWIGALQDRNMTVADGENGLPWTVLAAGCQVKWQEVGRKFQGRMVGLVGSEMDEY